MRIEYSVISDVGLRRQNNEDNFYIDGKVRKNVAENHTEFFGTGHTKNFFAAVFDGMGGEEKGEIASLEAANILRQYEGASFAWFKDRYVWQINKQLCDMMRNEMSNRMGSTLAVVHLRQRKLSICNLGDSAIFLIRGGSIEQLSVNHNEAQRLVDMGVISKRDYRHSREKCMLTQHLGVFEEEMILEPHILENIQVRNGDYILLCSDGLTDMLEEEKIFEIIHAEKNVSAVTKQLLEQALKKGGIDNITTMLLRVRGFL